MDFAQFVIAATAGVVAVLAIQMVIKRAGRGIPPHIAHQNRILASVTGIEMATLKLTQHLKELESRMSRVESLQWPVRSRTEGTGSK